MYYHVQISDLPSIMNIINVFFFFFLPEMYDPDLKTQYLFFISL